MEIGHSKKFSKKIGNITILIVIMVILFCSFTMSQYFLKIKLGETKDSVNTIVENFDRDKSNISDIIDKYPIYNSIIQVCDISEDVMISKKQFTKQIDYGNLTIEGLHNALEPYKVSVLNGNSISGIIKLSEVKGDVMIIGQPLKDANEKVVGAIFALKFTKEFNAVLIGLNTVLSFSMIFILISIE